MPPKTLQTTELPLVPTGPERPSPLHSCTSGIGEEWGNATFLEFGEPISVESSVGGNVNTIRVLRIFFCRPKIATIDDIRDEVRGVWLGKLSSSACFDASAVMRAGTLKHGLSSKMVGAVGF
jgi:hypothetical protein